MPLVVAANHLTSLPGTAHSRGLEGWTRLFTFPSLETGAVLTALAIAATVVVALTFSQKQVNLPLDEGDESLQHARLRLRFAFAAYALGIAVTTLTVIFAVGLMASADAEGDAPSRLIMAVVVVIVGQSIVFAAAHTQPREEDHELVAARQLPRLLKNHRELDHDQRTRWSIDTSQRPGDWARCFAIVAAIAYPVIAMVVLTIAVVLLYPEPGNPATVPALAVQTGVALCTLPALVLRLAASSFQRWIWLLAPQLTLGLFLASLLASVIFAWSFPKDIVLRDCADRRV